jgi:hypothetical protein
MFHLIKHQAISYIFLTNLDLKGKRNASKGCLKGVLACFGKLVVVSLATLKSVFSTTFSKINLITVFYEGKLYNLSNLMGEGIG